MPTLSTWAFPSKAAPPIHLLCPLRVFSCCFPPHCSLAVRSPPSQTPPVPGPHPRNPNKLPRTSQRDPQLLPHETMGPRCFFPATRQSGCLEFHLLPSCQLRFPGNREPSGSGATCGQCLTPAGQPWVLPHPVPFPPMACANCQASHRMAGPGTLSLISLGSSLAPWIIGSLVTGWLGGSSKSMSERQSVSGEMGTPHPGSPPWGAAWFCPTPTPRLA